MNRLWNAIILSLTGCALILSPGCEATDPSQPETLQLESPTTEKLSSRQRALQAKKQLAQELSGRLIQAISTRGVAAAISVCKEDATKIAKRVGDELKVTIGRTSMRLRNPDNGSPDWAKPLVEQNVEEDQFVDLPNGRLGALLPIRLGAQCLTCHGPPEQIDEQVKVALAEHYPEDQATGFQPGDLRGWFWVEVPK